MKRITGSREALLAIVLIVLFVIVTAISPSFLTPKSLMDMLKNNAVMMVMALGMLCVMLVGGIDISIMSTLALSGMAIGMMLKYDVIANPVLAFVIAIAIGIACGFVVGLVISRADVPPIIATMGFMYIYRAMGYLISNGGEWASAAALGSFKDFATTNLLGINCVIWVIVVCYAFFFWFMKWTRTGRKIYAVGSNAEAAEVSGINVKNIKLLVYVIMGLLSGLGGALQVSGYAVRRRDGCHRSLRYRRRQHERRPRNRAGSSSRISDPGDYCKSPSADSFLQSAVAEYHQGCDHSCGCNHQHCSAACS